METNIIKIRVDILYHCKGYVVAIKKQQKYTISAFNVNTSLDFILFLLHWSVL
jgi:hypothetical protein